MTDVIKKEASFEKNSNSLFDFMKSEGTHKDYDVSTQGLSDLCSSQKTLTEVKQESIWGKVPESPTCNHERLLRKDDCLVGSSAPSTTGNKWDVIKEEPFDSAEWEHLMTRTCKAKAVTIKKESPSPSEVSLFEGKPAVVIQTEFIETNCVRHSERSTLNKWESVGQMERQSASEATSSCSLFSKSSATKNLPYLFPKFDRKGSIVTSKPETYRSRTGALDDDDGKGGQAPILGLDKPAVETPNKRIKQEFLDQFENRPKFTRRPIRRRRVHI
ncbi:uncharacterized protein LOC111259115 [Varroa jacobsoni]|uniref:uncharacterized protein LOC111259115 n=1 Tax=Varroa jacobsoni TaxID=62625 RepID=UPI000BF816CF|nr:uncharacterized protein LOC111259115 [Varroa jacobsoni]